MGLVLVFFWRSVTAWIYSRLGAFNSRLGVQKRHFPGKIEKIPGSTGKTGNSAQRPDALQPGACSRPISSRKITGKNGETQRLWRAPASETAHIRPAASKDMPSMPPGTA